MIVAVLSAGAVGTGDAMGKEVPENIRLAARADGVLVKPDRPMVPTDDNYLREAGEMEMDASKRPSIGFTAWTCTDHGDHRTLYGFAFAPGTKKVSDVDVGWIIAPAALGIRSPVYVYDVTRKQGVALVAGEPYHARLRGSQYAFVIIAPIGPSGIAFLGDADKIASTGKQRISDIRESAEALRVTVLTAPGESAVTLHGFAEVAPACQLVDGKTLPVQYDAATKHFTVAVTVPATGGESVVTFRHAGTRTARE
jgi:hypothetical protein